MRKYEKTIDVKTAIKSVLVLFVVEKMLRSSVRDWPQLRFSPERPVCISQILKQIRVRNSEATLCFFIPFLSNVDFSIIAKVICNRKDYLMVIIISISNR